MGRKRKNPADNRLPAGVYLAKGRYVYRKWADGKLSKETVLCPADAPISQIWQAYEALQTAAAPAKTLAWLMNQYLQSAKHQALAPRTRKDYAAYAAKIAAAKLKNGATFGDIEADAITRGTMQKYHDKRAEAAPVQANRELAFLSVCYEWALNRDMVKANPCKGVERTAEKPKTIYVDDYSYRLMHQAAQASTYPYLAPIMELAYLCRLRLCEILDLTRADIRPDALHTPRRKGSRATVIQRSPRLNAAIDAALAWPRKIRSINPATDYLIPAKSGGRLGESTVQTAWDRLIKKNLPTSPDLQRFSLHDLKAKGITDFDGNKQEAAGHRTPAMADAYDRLPHKVKPTRE